MKNLFVLVLLVALPQLSWAQKGKWKKAQKEHTIESYQEFLEKYPMSEFRAEAYSRLVQLEFAQVTSSNQVPALESFIEKYPESTFVDSVRAQIVWLDYSFAVQSTSLGPQEDFLAKHPDSKFAPQIRERKAFLEAQEANSIWAYQGFLEGYPDGSYAGQAKAAVATLKKDFLNILTSIAEEAHAQNYNLTESRVTEITHSLSEICQSDMRVLVEVSSNELMNKMEKVTPLDSLVAIYGAENKGLVISIREIHFRLLLQLQERVVESIKGVGFRELSSRLEPYANLQKDLLGLKSDQVGMILYIMSGSSDSEDKLRGIIALERIFGMIDIAGSESGLVGLMTFPYHISLPPSEVRTTLQELAAKEEDRGIKNRYASLIQIIDQGLDP